MNPHFLNGIHEIPRNASVAIYGTGAYGVALSAYIDKKRSDVKVYCFFDSFNEGMKDGKPVFTSDKISLQKKHFGMILIGSDGFRNEIHDKLQSLGYDNYYDVWFLESMLFETEENITPTSIKTISADNKDKTLFAFYDLRVSPYTFDAFSFMVLAEFRRLELKKDTIHMFIIKDEQSDTWNWNIYNVIVPLTQFIHSLSATTITKPNEFTENLIRHKDCFPAGYSAESPVAAYSLKKLTKTIRQAGFKPDISSTKKAREFIGLWLEKNCLRDSKLVTVTLRQSIGYLDRNSSIDQWLLFSDYLKENGYTPVILKDTYSLFNPDQEVLDKYLTFDMASLNLELRMALYESAYVNIGLANGPLVLCNYSNHIPYLVHMKLNDNYWATLPRYLAEMGLPVGTQFPLAKKNQVLGWSYDDNFETLKTEFEEFVKTNPVH